MSTCVPKLKAVYYSFIAKFTDGDMKIRSLCILDLILIPKCCLDKSPVFYPKMEPDHYHHTAKFTDGDKAKRSLCTSDLHSVPNCSPDESQVFCLKMKAAYYYIVEITCYTAYTCTPRPKQRCCCLWSLEPDGDLHVAFRAAQMSRQHRV